MKTAKYMYRCRLCGAQFFDGTESSAERSSRILQDISIFGKDMSGIKGLYGDNAVNGMSVSLVRTHECYGTWGADMAEGLADLIGFMVEK
jgi:hypothetical protein